MKLKRFGTCAVAMALMASLGIQPAAAASTMNVYRLSVPSGYQNVFTDVQTSDWYYEYVAVLNSRGMIDGYADGRFGPNDELTSGGPGPYIWKADLVPGRLL